MKTVVLITGASRGLGKVIYDQLSEVERYHVYGTSRNPGKSDLLPLDVRSEASVTACITGLMDKEGQIDVLINNVGVNLIGSLEGTTMDEFMYQVDVNCLGAARMIKGVLPYLRTKGHGRIINISSIGARIPLPYNSSYAASKAALEGMSESLAYELDGTDIYVSLLMPIGLKIESQKPTLTYVANESAVHRRSREMYDLMRTKVVPNVTNVQVANKVRMVMKKPKPRLRYHVGPLGVLLLAVKSFMPNSLFRRWMIRQFIKK